MPLTETALTLAFIFLGSAYYASCKSTEDSRRSKVLPPGPPAKPIIGNLLDFAEFRRRGWTKLTEYKSIYGDLVFFHGLGTNILILNSLQAIDDLFEKRPLIYSDRPSLTVAGDLMGLNYSAAFMCHGKEWREHRHMAHAALGPSATGKYHARLEDVSAVLNVELLNDPREFVAHVRLMAARLALGVTYGLSVNEAGRDYIAHAEKTMALVRNATVPGRYLADVLPILKYLPSCFPFHQHAARGRAMIDYLITMPFEYVKQRMEEGTAPPSLTRDLLSQDTSDDPAAHEHRVKWIAGTNYSASSEAISTAVLTFVLAMATHPAKQKLAQDEIDLLGGAGAYVRALIKETIRWRPSLPFGIMRCTHENDEYRGYWIPKGTVVIPNSWAIAFAPNEKYDPRAFVPERFLDPDPGACTVDPGVWAFGYGRRMCPGKTFAEEALDVIVPGILRSFDVLPTEDGVLDADVDVNSCCTEVPTFECRIVPRSVESGELVRKRAEGVRV